MELSHKAKIVFMLKGRNWVVSKGSGVRKEKSRLAKMGLESACFQSAQPGWEDVV